MIFLVEKDMLISGYIAGLFLVKWRQIKVLESLRLTSVDIVFRFGCHLCMSSFLILEFV